MRNGVTETRNYSSLILVAQYVWRMRPPWPIGSYTTIDRSACQTSGALGFSFSRNTYEYMPQNGISDKYHKPIFWRIIACRLQECSRRLLWDWNQTQRWSLELWLNVCPLSETSAEAPTDSLFTVHLQTNTSATSHFIFRPKTQSRCARSLYLPLSALPLSALPQVRGPGKTIVQVRAIRQKFDSAWYHVYART